MLLGCNKKDDADDILSIRPYEKKKSWLIDFFRRARKGLPRRRFATLIKYSYASQLDFSSSTAAFVLPRLSNS